MKYCLSLLMGIYLSLNVTAQTQGPQNGHLIIAGGALRDTTVFNKFIELAGGQQSHILVIPTAGGYEVTENRRNRIIEQWKARGVQKVSVLHTESPSEANQESFAAVLDQATGVYFPGGRQWRLADSYLNTLVEKKLFDLLDRGGVIGGSSAGATIQGSYLARGDSQTNTIMMGDHEEGLSFVSNIAIDQHTLARNRQFDMFEILTEKPELLGISLDENTAIHVNGNQFEVLGESYVLVYDGTHWDQTSRTYVKNTKGQERFHLLSAGQKYNLFERKVIR